MSEENSLHGTLPDPIPSLHCNLQVLRTLGPDALDTTGVPGLLAATLRTLTTVWDDAACTMETREANDLLHDTAQPGHLPEPIPRSGTLAHARIEVKFTGSPAPHAVELAPPNHLKFESPADAQLLRSWLTQRGLLTPADHLAQVLLFLSFLALQPPLSPEDQPGEASPTEDTEQAFYIPL